MTPCMWLWSAGTRCGASDDRAQARKHAEQAALKGACPVLLELVTIGFDGDLQPMYVRTDIAYSGTARGDQVAWGPFVRVSG